MRIIAGKFGGRVIHEPHGHKTHPMSEKIRGALFNALGDIRGITFLDAFAGSGALSFEAISRGAKSSVAVEKEKTSHSSMQMSINDLGLAKNIKAIRANIGGWSIHNMERKFDAVLLDPPYDDINQDLLKKLAKRHAKAGGVVILSLPPNSNFSFASSGFLLLSTKSYGDAQLVFYRKIK